MLKHLKGKLEEYQQLLMQPYLPAKGHYISIKIETHCTHQRAEDLR